jgi:tRNA threonylcarbamoyladenosine biosynthesis protein TsaE
MFKSENLNSWDAGGQSSVDLALSDVPLLAKALAKRFRPLDFMLLSGDLGAGKTTFVAHLARSMGSQQLVASPTFSLLNVIDLPNSVADSVARICHMDLYRIRRAEELMHLGLEIEFSASAIAIIEWSENVEGEGWKRFFDFTRCKKPMRILTLSIENLPDSEKRRYSFDWLSFNDFTSD